jgi:hypothetical protein
VMLTLAIVGANLVLIIVINCRRYSSFIHPQVRQFRIYVYRWEKLQIYACNWARDGNVGEQWIYFKIFYFILEKIINNFSETRAGH